MQGEELIANDVADEIIVQATLYLPARMSEGEVAAITLAEWKAAIVAVLARYGARLSDDEEAAS